MAGRTFSDKRTRQIQEEQARLARAKTQLSPEEKAGDLDRARMLFTLLDLNEKQREDMANWVQERMEIALGSKERRDALERLRRARTNYESGVARDDLPFENAHDIRLKWGASQCDTIAVRIGSGLFGLDPIFRVSGRNVTSLDKARPTENFLDWWHDEKWKLADRGPEITENVVRDGHVVLFQPWRVELERDQVQHVEKQKWVDPVTGKERWIDVDDLEEQVDAVKLGLNQEQDFKVVDEKKNRVIMNGPDLEDHPLDDYAWAPWATPKTKQIPYEAIKQWYFYDTVKEMEEEGELYPGAAEKIANYAEQPPSGRDKLEKGENAKADRQLAGLPGDAVVQFWLWFGLCQVPGQDRLQRVEVLYHMPTKTVCSARRFPYDHKKSPFDHLRFYKLDWRMDGMGAMEMFESIEQIMQNLINYQLDDTYVRAAMSFRFRENRWDPEDHPLKPFRGVAVKSHTDVEPFTLPDYRNGDMGIFSTLVGFGERRVQVGPYQQGQESPTNTRPTARGIFLLLDEAKKMFDKAVRTQLSTWKSVVEKEMAMWQQMMPEHMAVDAIGSDEKALFPEGMGRRYIIGQFGYQMSGNVEAVLHEMDLQMNMSLYDLLKDNPFIRTSVSAMYHLTEDLINAFRKKRKLLPPLEKVQEQMGLTPDPEILTAQEERDLRVRLKARGMKPQEIDDTIEELRAVPAQRRVPGPTVPPAEAGAVPGAPPAAAGPVPPNVDPETLLSLGAPEPMGAAA